MAYPRQAALYVVEVALLNLVAAPLLILSVGPDGPRPVGILVVVATLYGNAFVLFRRIGILVENETAEPEDSAGNG